jgi:hypothetical protein
MSKRNQNLFRPGLTILENREVPTVGLITLSGGVLTVKANNAITNILITQPSGYVVVTDSIIDHTWVYNASQINQVVVVAGSGTDVFTTGTRFPNTAKLVRFVGGSGTDTFVSTSGNVSMQAGSGSDTLTATAGNDTLVGGAGADYMKGSSGTTLIEAGTGNDYMNGGTGTATIVGGIGNDTIVAMNGEATDTIDTGIGSEVLWVDSLNGVTDNIIGSTTNDVVQAISSFANAGATTTLNGGTFREPTPLPGNTYEVFANRPLFASGGATYQDVKQYINPAGGGVNGTGTNLDDSWLLAGLAAIALEDPQTIEDNVVNFGDGTYGVKLGDEYFRVDDKLPVNVPGETFTAYASVGVQDSIWVPIVEKAFAYYASPQGIPSYSNLLAANGGAATEVYAAFGATTVGSDTLSGNGGFANATDLGLAIASVLNSNFSTSVGLTSTVAGTDVNTGAAVTLVANREYTVLSYDFNLNGQVTSVVLRDPSGANPAGVVVTIANLFAATGTLDFGNP